MLNKLQKRKIESSNKGFTIIEVMIVLAIAGLILLIVFLAVPALQRNGRNTQRKSDIGNITAAVNDFVTNNNGLLPDTGALVGGALKLSNAAVASTPVTSSKIGYYTVAPVFKTFATAPGYGFGAYHHNDVLSNLLLSPVASAAAPPAATVGPDSVYVVTGATCNGNAIAAGSARGFAVMYELEQSGSTATGGGVAQCAAS